MCAICSAEAVPAASVGAALYVDESYPDVEESDESDGRR